MVDNDRVGNPPRTGGESPLFDTVLQPDTLPVQHMQDERSGMSNGWKLWLAALAAAAIALLMVAADAGRER